MNRPALFLLLLAVAGCGRPTRTPARPDGPVRLVSLAPSLTEITAAIGAGDLLVGRTDVCNYPPEVVASVPVVGGFGVPSLEAIARQRATLVIDVDLEDESVGSALDRLGIARQRVPCHHLDDIAPAIRTVGRLTGRPEAAGALADDLAARIAALRAAQATASPESRPRVFVEIWSDPIMTVGRGSFIAELVALAGGRNLGDEAATEYFTASPEWVLARNPDVILAVYMSYDHTARRRIMARPGWRSVAAVRTGRVHDGFDPDVICRPGPRVLQAAAALAEAIAPPAP